MVAEQARKVTIWLVSPVRWIIKSMTTITSSSSGRKEKKERFKWNLHLRKEAEISMFSRDRFSPHIPHPTSFDGVKTSFMEWSEEIMAFLAVTDYQKFIPLLSVQTSWKPSTKRNQTKSKPPMQAEPKMFKIPLMRSPDPKINWN